MRMMLKIFQEKPDYLAITWDTPTKTARHEMFTDYKANRPEAPEDLKYQIPMIIQVTQELSIPSHACPGYEADDVIHTLVHNYKNNQGIQISLLTSDKDMKQLLCDNVVVKDPIKNITTTTKDFIQEYNFPPINIVDYLALIGDSADNIKGVPGIGPKKAQTLIEKYHTIENIYEHLDELSGELKSTMQQYEFDALYCKKLIMLQAVPDLDKITLDHYKLQVDFDLYKRVLVEQHGFHSIQKLIDDLKNIRTKPQQTSLFG